MAALVARVAPPLASQPAGAARVAGAFGARAPPSLAGDGMPPRAFASRPAAAAAADCGGARPGGGGGGGVDGVAAVVACFAAAVAALA